MVLNGKKLLFCMRLLNFTIIFFIGELDHLPEGAFYMVGGIEDVSARAEKLASER
jgi:F0F1-type ATP synthase beta subunit